MIKKILSISSSYTTPTPYSTPTAASRPPQKGTYRRRIPLNNIMTNRFGLRRDSKLIGEGAFGKVYQTVVNQRTLAVKIAKENYAYILKAEIDIALLLQKNSHRNIVSVIKTYALDNFPMLALEFAPYGSLYNFQKSPQVLPNFFFSNSALRDIHFGLCHLHKHKILHRDLKPENCLVFQQPNQNPNSFLTKISDFGSAIVLDNPQKIIKTKHVTSRFYRIPNQDLQIPYGKEVDWWSWLSMVPEVFNLPEIFNSKKDGNPHISHVFSRLELLKNPDQNSELSIQFRDRTVKFLGKKTCPSMSDLYRNTTISCVINDMKGLFLSMTRANATDMNTLPQKCMELLSKINISQQPLKQQNSSSTSLSTTTASSTPLTSSLATTSSSTTTSQKPTIKRKLPPSPQRRTKARPES